MNLQKENVIENIKEEENNLTEFIRGWFDSSGWFDFKKKFFKKIESLQFFLTTTAQCQSIIKMKR